MRAVRADYACRLRLWLDIPVIAVTLVAGVYLWHSEGLTWSSMMSLGVSCAFTLMLIIAFLVIPKLLFRREPKLHDQYSLTFSEQGIRFNTEHIDSQLEWSLYSRALIDTYSYILYHGARSFTVIPKRVFESNDQEKNFRNLLTQKVPEIVAKN